VLVAGTLFYIGFTGLEPVLPSLVSRYSPETAYGTALGIYNSLQFLGSFAGGSVSGALSHLTSSHAMMVTLMGASLVGTLLMLSQPRN
jgi:MFS family permease